MPAKSPRSAEQRKRDTLTKLREPNIDVWVATASASVAMASQAHLVPLSLAWIGDRVVTAMEPTSRTARNLQQSGHARLALGPTRDLVMLDAEVETVTIAAELEDGIGQAYASQVGWDPRRESDPFVFVIFRPIRIQAWREANEIPGRTLMTDGRWLI
jgi:hypothetical protein